MRNETDDYLASLKLRLPQDSQPRWSRLFARPQFSLPLPVFSKATP